MAETFKTDVAKFLRNLDAKLDSVLEGSARDLHAAVRDYTPYRTGRARASWNVKAYSSDDAPAPDIGLGGFDSTEKEVAAANVFYDSLIRSKANFKLPVGARVVHITNTVHYIERLNAGSSRQAPAGFFNAIVASAGLIVRKNVKAP